MTFHEFTQILAWVWLPLIFMDWVVVFWAGVEAKELWNFWFPPLYVVVMFLFAVDALQRNEWGLVALFSFFALVGAWVWWHNDKHRRKRKRLLDRGYGRVVNIGGRLKVIRPAQEST